MYPPLNAPTLDSRLQSIRKTTVAFASLFKEIPFIKYNTDGTVLEQITVPIIYGDKEKYVKRLDIPQEKVQITLPRIEYGLVNVEYDASRRTNQANKLMSCKTTGSAYVHSPMPYNFNFELVLYTRNIEDANQIMEYIVPFFYPDYNIKINMVPELNIVKNIPIRLTGDSQEQDSTGAFDSPVRSVFRTLTFTARSYIFQPPKYFKPILQANTNIFVPSSVNGYQLANGYGTFLQGERVFQGPSYDRPSGTATVTYFNPNTLVIKLSNIKGNIVANSTLYNIARTKQYNITSLPDNGLYLTTKDTPSPNTYPVTGPYEVITEKTYYSG